MAVEGIESFEGLSVCVVLEAAIGHDATHIKKHPLDVASHHDEVCIVLGGFHRILASSRSCSPTAPRRQPCESTTSR